MTQSAPVTAAAARMLSDEEPSRPARILDLTVFVPCFNEAEAIERTLDTIRKALRKFPLTYEVLVVDDGSSDRTREIVASYIERHELHGKVILIKNERNRGIGINYFTTAERARGSYYLTLFGDNSEPTSAIRSIVNLLGKADMIIPNFNTKLFSRRYNRDTRRFPRRLTSIVFNRFLVRVLSGCAVHYYNGPVLHRTDNVLKYRVPASGLSFQAEMLCKMLADHLTYLEVTITNNDRQEGSTTAFRPKNIASVAASLVRIPRNRLANRQAGLRRDPPETDDE